MFVWVVFRVNEFDEEMLWKIFDSETKAIEWIKEYGQWAKFIYEKIIVN